MTKEEIKLLEKFTKQPFMLFDYDYTTENKETAKKLVEKDMLRYVSVYGIKITAIGLRYLKLKHILNGIN